MLQTLPVVLQEPVAADLDTTVRSSYYLFIFLVDLFFPFGGNVTAKIFDILIHSFDFLFFIVFGFWGLISDPDLT